MHWVLQNNIFKEEAYDNFIGVLERFGLPYSEHRVVPFIGALIPLGVGDEVVAETYSDPLLAALKGPVICMGSYSMRHAAKKYGWNPGVFDLMEGGNFQQCMKHWGKYMLNADSVVIPFKDASWPSGERFIRPTDDSKHFAGKMIEADEFREWQINVCKLGMDFGDGLLPSTLIQVATPKKIYAEYRCWVVDGDIVTMSLYKRGDTVIYQNMDGTIGDEAGSFAYEVLNSNSILAITGNHGWQPARAFCLDVCETDEGWRIVEINTLNSCGFYAANLTSLVLALEDAFNNV